MFIYLPTGFGSDIVNKYDTLPILYNFSIEVLNSIKFNTCF